MHKVELSHLAIELARDEARAGAALRRCTLEQELTPTRLSGAPHDVEEHVCGSRPDGDPHGDGARQWVAPWRRSPTPRVSHPDKAQEG
jgi:hypothetical protein